jgi:hypothetical protein
LDSVPVSVTASVVGVCKFFGSGYTIAFGNIDPAVAGPAQGSVDITYRCANGTTPVFKISGNAITGSTVNLSRSGGGSMTANLTGPASPTVGSGMGNDLTLTIQASIAQTGAGGYQNAPVGAYTGSFTVDVTP